MVRGVTLVGMAEPGRVASALAGYAAVLEEREAARAVYYAAHARMEEATQQSEAAYAAIDPVHKRVLESRGSLIKLFVPEDAADAARARLLPYKADPRFKSCVWKSNKEKFSFFVGHPNDPRWKIKIVFGGVGDGSDECVVNIKLYGGGGDSDFSDGLRDFARSVVAYVRSSPANLKAYAFSYYRSGMEESHSGFGASRMSPAVHRTYGGYERESVHWSTPTPPDFSGLADRLRDELDSVLASWRRQDY